MPAHLALLWHQHQPYYPDDVSGDVLMPWVRLHATKSYIGMALHIQEVPELRCTVNLVPSLLVQLQRYVTGGSDRHLDHSRRPADGLSEAEVLYLLDYFFMSNLESMIRPWGRYHELYLKRDARLDTAEKAAKRFSIEDLRDLQVWSNLSWFHPLLFEQDRELAEFRRRGRGWTEEEKLWLLDRQRQVVSRVIPLHRELQDRGQIEITTTPFFHPILPLLWDKRSAREAMPRCELPESNESYAEDARHQLQRGVEYHRQLFGQPPRGMWPSEGSVSQEILPAIAETGIEWIATDEEILAESLDGHVGRDAAGRLRNPELLYRPWLIGEEGQPLSILFRDHQLSDQIGFHYQRYEPQQAVDDFVSRVRSAAPLERAGRPPLVPVILDGENCWEYYPDGGVEFLRTLYRTIAADSQIESTTGSGYLDRYPATDRIPRLFAGSWINHNFAIWIGHQEDREAWDRLDETRQFLKKVEKDGTASSEQLRAAWEELLIAEGSDWFWWYGDDHSSELDTLFDALFRKHLQNVYLRLDEAAPEKLYRPISRSQHNPVHTQPRSLLHVRVDGIGRYFEWIDAGSYVAGSERGTMTMVAGGVIRQLRFGFTQGHLLLGVETRERAKDDLRETDEVRIRFSRPSGLTVVVSQPAHSPAARFVERETSEGTLLAAIDRILEVQIPLPPSLPPGERIEFHIELVRGGKSVERIPPEANLNTIVAGSDFERRSWQT